MKHSSFLQVCKNIITTRNTSSVQKSLFEQAFYYQTAVFKRLVSSLLPLTIYMQQNHSFCNLLSSRHWRKLQNLNDEHDKPQEKSHNDAKDVHYLKKHLFQQAFDCQTRVFNVTSNGRGSSFERNCVLRRGESKTLK